MPRRLALTLPELRLVAELAGGAPLPSTCVRAPPVPDARSLAGRLGESRGSRRGLRVHRRPRHAARPGGHPAPARPGDRRRAPTPAWSAPSACSPRPGLALDIDVAAGGTQVKAWHRQAGDAVASLSTCDGIVFELAWFPVDQWTTELARVGGPRGPAGRRASHVPAHSTSPSPSPTRSARRCAPAAPTWSRCWWARPTATVLAPTARAAGRAESTPCSRASHTEGRGRLRVLAAEVSGDETTVGRRRLVGAARRRLALPHAPQTTTAPACAVARVDPADLATELAPVLAQVTGMTQDSA